MPRGAKPRLAALAALCLASAGLFAWDGRFATVAEAILPDLDFAQGLAHWQATPSGVRLDVAGDVVAFSVGVRAPIAVLSRPVPVPRRFSHVRVAAEIKLAGLRPGRQRWQQGGVMLRSFDGNGNRLWYWPYEVALVSGSSGWRAVAAVIPVAPAAAAMRLYAYHAGTAGTMWLRALALDAVAETRSFRVARAALVFLWLAAGVWLAAPLVRQRRLSARLALLAGLAILASVLTPQPQFRNALDGATARLDRLLAPQPAAVEPAAPAPGPRAGPISDLRGRRIPGLGPEATGHLAAYAVLALLAFAGFRETPPRELLVYLLAAALATEFLQAFTVTRTAAVADGAMNVAGVVLGSAAALLWRALARRLARRQRTSINPG